eukprot:Mrub_07870.p1 GENE.Mrub_07870~~Mrub_07870.p1  ORF type:complete len:231 (+),score=81.50 Mrub_07870:48-695(+)
MLQQELEEDILDNGILDCLRYIPPKNSKLPESPEDSNLRIMAQWTTDCAFEAEYDWKTPFYEAYQIKGKKLTSARGDDYKFEASDDSDQADMCELVRTMIKHKFFKVDENSAASITLDELKDVYNSVFPKIKCAKGVGVDGPEAPGICAVNSGSYYESSKWVILYGGELINVGVEIPPEDLTPEEAEAAAQEAEENPGKKFSKFDFTCQVDEIKL